MSLAYDESGWRTPRLDSAAARRPLASRTRAAEARDLLTEAISRHGRRLALVSSFGAESAVLLHLAAALDPTIAVLFLDTGMLFGQTLDYRKSLTRRLGLANVRDLRPSAEDLALADPAGDLWRGDPDACCGARKVVPLERALAGFDAWITGRKRFQAAERLHLPVVEQAKGKTKYNPLANWSPAELEAYARAHDLPSHPLAAAGFSSIGCWPCTTPVEKGEQARAGRWRGSEKTECGIHGRLRATVVGAARERTKTGSVSWIAPATDR